MKTFASFAAEGFEKELRDEITRAPGVSMLAEYERLFVLRAEEPRDFAWAQNTWLEPEEIPIRSIKDGARVLRSRGRDWALYPSTLYRRANLIQAELPKLRQPKVVEFLSSQPNAKPSAWTLLKPDLILASASCTSAYAGGEVHLADDLKAPSRAYRKLWELFTAHGVRPPAPGEHCLDLGACPGGWTYVLARQLGARVTAVDRAPLAPELMALSNVRFIKGNAFTLAPESIEPVDWLFSDLICYPDKLIELIEAWRASGRARNFVCTIKFQGETDHAATEKLAAIPGARVKHLFCNKHELTWWLVR